MQTLIKQKLKEFSWRNITYNGKFSAETRLEHGIAIEYKESQ